MKISFEDLLKDTEFQRTVPCEVRNYHTGEAIIREDDPGTEIYLILSGKAEVYTEVATPVGPGRRTGLCRLSDNDVIGELSLFDHQARIADVIAMTDCRIAVIDGLSLEKFMGEHPERGYWILKEMFRQLVRRMRQAAVRTNTITALYLNDNAV